MQNSIQQFETLALRHMDALYTKAIRITSNMTEAEALVQETYLRAFERFYKFDSRDNFEDWLLQILFSLKRPRPKMVDLKISSTVAY